MDGKKFKWPIVIGLILLCLYFAWNDQWHKTSFEGVVSSSALQTIGAAYATAMLLYAYRRTGWGNRHLAYFGYGMFMYTLAQAYWTVSMMATGCEPDFVGIPETLWTIQYFFYVVALFKQFQGHRNRRRMAIDFVLDILLFAAVSTTIYWQLQINPLVGEERLSGMLAWFSLINSSFNAVVLFLLVFLALNGRKSYAQASTLLLIVGFGLRQSGNTTFAFYLPTTEAGSDWSWISDLCWFLGVLFVGFAAIPEIARGMSRIRPPAPTAAARFFRKHATVLIVCVALIAIVGAIGDFSPLTIGAIVTIALLAIRLSVGAWELESTDAARRQSDINYRNFIDNSLVGVFIEQNGALAYVNRHAEQIFGYEAGAMLGKPLSAYVSPEDRDRIERRFHAWESPSDTVRLHLTARKTDQTELYLELHAAISYHGGRPAISGTILDVTESKLSEQRLIRSEKLSVVGQLAAGVAHEIRNPLTALKGFTQLLYKSADHNRGYYEMMLTELERINYIVGEFMLLSKPTSSQQLVPYDMSKLLDDIVPIMQSQAIITNANLEVRAERNLPNVVCEVNQIKQVLINLMKNGIEAMPQGGQLDVRLRAEDGHVVFEVADEGSGIPSDVLNRLGEPFLTTKEKGTGLGLTVCFKIIQNHGGTLTFASEPGKGTVATVRLPAGEKG